MSVRYFFLLESNVLLSLTCWPRIRFVLFFFKETAVKMHNGKFTCFAQPNAPAQVKHFMIKLKKEIHADIF